MASPLSSPPRATYQDVLDAPPNMVAEVKVALFDAVGFPLNVLWVD